MRAIISVEMDMLEVAQEVGFNLDNEDIIQFILQIDSTVADEMFTKRLIKKLKKTLKDENL